MPLVSLYRVGDFLFIEEEEGSSIRRLVIYFHSDGSFTASYVSLTEQQQKALGRPLATGIALLGLRSVQGTTGPWLCLLTQQERVGYVPSIGDVFKITAVSWYSATCSAYDADHSRSVPYVTVPGTFPIGNEHHPCANLRRLLCSGNFYCSAEAALWESDEFCWNLEMHRALPSSDLFPSRFLIQGYVSAWHRPIEGCSVGLFLVSRISRARAGTRFRARGIDDNGNCAMTAVTVQIAQVRGQVLKISVMRGSVPLHWEQSGTLPHPVRWIREPQSSVAAFERHFKRMTDRFGMVAVVDLLSRKCVTEAELSLAYKRIASHSEFVAGYLHIDFDALGEEGQKLSILKKLAGLIDRYSDPDGGIVRFNCLDCLDRTNVAQATFVRAVLESRLGTLSPPCARAFSDQWLGNGDALSRAYAGTSALRSSGLARDAQKPRFFSGLVGDVGRSAARLLQQVFSDEEKNQAMQILLNGPPNNERLSTDAATGEKLRLCCLTWNVNGAEPNAVTVRPDWYHGSDVVAVSLQEAVALSASSLLRGVTNSDRSPFDSVCDAWRRSLIPPEQSGLVLVCSRRMTGVIFLLWCRPQLAMSITDVSIGSSAEGFAGVAQNKGAIRCRFKIAGAPFSFLAVHLPAGQNDCTARNQAFRSISRRLLGGDIAAENVVWFGDFNYRLEKFDESAAKRGDWSALWSRDQLRMQISSGLAFVGLLEGALNFAPTYKWLANGRLSTDRVPSWTDRVLWRGSHLRLERYDSLPTSTGSDHHPVFAAFFFTI